MKKRQFAAISFAILMILTMLTACGGGGTSGGSGGSGSSGSSSKGSFIPTAVNKDSVGIKLDEKYTKEADKLSAKVKVLEGMGDFGITVYKVKDDVSSFVLKVENKNDFPSAALVECSIRGADGKIKAVTSISTSVMVAGALDIAYVTMDKDAWLKDFETLEIKAFAKEPEKNTARMISYYDSSKVKLTPSGTESGGMYDKWQKVEVKLSTTDSVIGDALTMFYDADGYLIHQGNVRTNEKNFYAYCQEPYDHVEIIVEKLIDGVQGLPESILTKYKESGYIDAFGKEYTKTSPDGQVEYYFEKAEDGSVVMVARNLTDKRLRWNLNDAIVYVGERYPATLKLYLNPGEELMWGMKFEKDSEFWFMEPIACQTDENLAQEPQFTLNEDEKIVLADITKARKALPEGNNNYVNCRVSVIYYKDGKLTASEMLGFYEEDLYYNNSSIEPLTYEGDYDSYEVYTQYWEDEFMMFQP
jgi:hypothetical protein